MTDVVLRDGPQSVARVLPVHEAVRRQLVEDIGEDRIAALREVLDDLTFNVALHWLSSARRGALSTKRGYAEEIAQFAAWAAEHLGQLPVRLLADVDDVVVTEWTVYAASRRWAVLTKRRKLSVLSSLFTYAAKHLPVRNPVDFEEHADRPGTSRTGKPPGETRVLEPTDVVAMRQACRTAEERLVFELLYLHGLRESEVENLAIQNVERGAGKVVVQIQRKGARWTKRELSEGAAAWLDELVGDGTEGPVLLDHAKGRGRDRHQIIEVTRRLARRGGVHLPEKVTPHDLRATAITWLLDAGKPPQEVQAWAGHVSPMTTLRYWRRRNAVARDAALTSALAAEIAELTAGIARVA